MMPLPSSPGDGELLFESEGRHEKIDEGSGVSTTDGGPDHGGVFLGNSHQGHLTSRRQSEPALKRKGPKRLLNLDS
jgi:hypothetical protein